MQEAQQLLTVPQAMTITQLSRATVYRLIDSGQLDVVRIGRTVRICRSSIDALIQRHFVAASNAS